MPSISAHLSTEMPSISAHLGTAIKVKQKLGISDDRFIFGALLPDITVIDKEKSHYKIQGTFYMIPDLEYYKSHFDLSDPLYFGYYFHLYLDYYYLEDYLENNNKGTDVFEGPTLKEIENILRKYANEEVNDNKLNMNINCLYLDKSGDLEYLKKEEFINFLDKQIDNFVKEMK